MPNERQKPGREESERRKAHWREGAIGALLDAKGQVDAQVLGSFQSLSREGKQCRNRSCLEQEHLAGGIHGPLDVLGYPKVCLDLRTKFRKVPYLLIRKADHPLALLNHFRPASDCCSNADLFASNASLDDLTGWRIHDEV